MVYIKLIQDQDYLLLKFWDKKALSAKNRTIVAEDSITGLGMHKVKVSNIDNYSSTETVLDIVEVPVSEVDEHITVISLSTLEYILERVL